MAFDKHQQYNAYNLATQTVPKTRQVVMLYDGAIRFMKQARHAIEENRIEDRFNLLIKTSEVLIGLQGCLDFENGGEIAPLLYDYYSSLDSRILYVQRTNDLKILDSVISELKQMRGAWGAVDEQRNAAEQPASEARTEPSATPDMPVEEVPTDGSVFVSA